MKHLLVFGPGYCAAPIMKRAQAASWKVTASYRTLDSKQKLEAEGYRTVRADAGHLNTRTPVSHLLITSAPTANGDPFLGIWKSWLEQQVALTAIHYLSSTNVYGDHGGGWVDETTPPTPSLARGHNRLAAERAWQAAARKHTQSACFIYRLAGIYGPGRNALETILAGKARRIIKPGQIFGRIHLEDISEILWAFLENPHQDGIYNLSDDLPAPPQDVIEAAAKMLGTDLADAINFNKADLSQTARSFYTENKRVSNKKVKKTLGLDLKYPTYHEGLAALFKDLKPQQP